MVGEPLPSDFLTAIDRDRSHQWADAPVVFFHEIGSTNDVAQELAASGTDEGTIVVALAQTAGRGRRGRTWTSPAGAGIYFSAVLRPTQHEKVVARGGPSRLTLLAAVAMVEAIEQASGVAAQIKWPNDLVIAVSTLDATGPWQRRKLAGILTEAAVSGSNVQHVVVGIGINLAPTAYPPDVCATSIQSESGRPASAAEVFASCRASLARHYAAVSGGGWTDVLECWRAHSPSSRGQRVRWLEGARTLDGVTCGLDDDGALKIEDGSGRVHRVLSGEVEWV